MQIVQLIFVSSVLFFSIVSNEKLELVVDTRLGSIRGSSMVSSTGRNFLAFRGIPYAQAPIGVLRFQDPEPVEHWEGVLDGTREGPTCLQFDSFSGKIKGVEDCLALNIYTHSLDTANGLRSVIVWIHGGGWMMGSGNGETDLFGPDLLMDKDIVLVTLNYRLGPFGFYTTDTEEAPGNYGLLDQTLALKWVRDHITHFGGNPKSVTIFGESAGGASVHFHVLSPRSKGLFHRAIAMSGSTLCPWAIPENGGTHSAALAKRVNCLKSSTVLECLRTVNAEELIDTPKDGIWPESVFGPRVDAERPSPFLPAHPRDLLERNQSSHVPFMTGITQNEGLIYLAGSGFLSGDENHLKNLNENPIESIISILEIKEKIGARDVAKRAAAQYLNLDLRFEQQLNELEQMSSDYTFFKCVDDAVTYHRRHSDQPIYYYFYTHRGEYSALSLIGIPNEIDYGVCHADELFLMFSSKLFTASSSPEDVAVSKTLVNLWTSFAVEGMPKSENVPHWSPVTKDNTNYLNINAEPIMVNEKMPFHHRLAFWDRVFHHQFTKGEL